MRKFFLLLRDDNQGQAVIEYVLMLSVAVSIVSIIGIGFRKTLFKLWAAFARDISAACPGCPPDRGIKFH